jgi:hypothetical protein
VNQAQRAREKALRLLRSSSDLDDEKSGGRDKEMAKSAAALTQEYLKESERLFELTTALVRAKQEHR